ncbi:unnamed protein product, partial [Prorocentrum cordatum]
AQELLRRKEESTKKRLEEEEEKRRLEQEAEEAKRAKEREKEEQREREREQREKEKLEEKEREVAAAKEKEKAANGGLGSFFSKGKKKVVGKTSAAVKAKEEEPEPSQAAEPRPAAPSPSPEPRPAASPSPQLSPRPDEEPEGPSFALALMVYRDFAGDVPEELETLSAKEDQAGWSTDKHGSALGDRRLQHGRTTNDMDSAPVDRKMFGSRRPQSSRELDSKDKDRADFRRRDRDEERIREEPPQPAAKLEVNPNSFAARMRARRAGAGGEDDPDAAVVRQLKSILNKLTLEKYDTLSQQILEVPMKTSTHVELLITEVFEKAITQHPFINMYTDLCVLLHDHFTNNPIADDAFSFKKLLLTECQNVFERNKQPPKDLDKMTEEDRVIAEFKYKNRKLGNVKFIGALLGRRMLASKVFLSIVE